MEMEAPGFWDNPDYSNKLMKELKNLKDFLEVVEGLQTSYEDIEILIDMAYEEEDESLVSEIAEELTSFETRFENLRIETLLSGEYDKDNAIVTLHAGAGGTESCDWAGMLYRMYSRWAERKGFALEVLDFLDGDVAGIKTITFQVNGQNAYGYLKSEKGVHRLVRISPFNAQGKRQTSFVSMDVMPDIEEDLDVEIEDKDLMKSTFVEYMEWVENLEHEPIDVLFESISFDEPFLFAAGGTLVLYDLKDGEGAKLFPNAAFRSELIKVQ